MFWECCSHCFHWGIRITLWLEGECTACTFSGCHNETEWKIAVFLWPKVQPLCIQGHGILGPWVLAVECCEHEISSFMCHFFHYAPSVSFFLRFPPMVFPWWSRLAQVALFLCVCVWLCTRECVLIDATVNAVFISSFLAICVDLWAQIFCFFT